MSHHGLYSNVTLLQQTQGACLPALIQANIKYEQEFAAEKDKVYLRSWRQARDAGELLLSKTWLPNGSSSQVTGGNIINRGLYGVGVVGSTNWSGPKQRAVGHGYGPWCQSWPCSVQFAGDAARGADALS